MNHISLKESFISDSVQEQIKTLRTQIRLAGEEKKVILVTSTESGEGKSQITQELCKAFAELEMNVLLIQADIRKYDVNSAIVPDPSKPGLSRYLAGVAKLDEVIYSTDLPHLYVLPFDMIPPNPSELLSQNKMRMLVRGCREKFDYVLIDSAPAGVVSDALVLASYSDGIVYMIYAEKQKVREVQKTVNALKKTGCPILGAVLNRKKMSKKSKYYYGYYS